MQKAKVFRFAKLACLSGSLFAQEFSKDIAPIFAANCIGCHASVVKMGSLDLDTMEGIRTGGNNGTVLVPGDSSASRLYLMVAGKMAPAMPLSGKSLAAGEVETIRKWIDAGAKAGEPIKVSTLNTTVTPDIKPKVAVKAQIAAIAYRPAPKLIPLWPAKKAPPPPP